MVRGRCLSTFPVHSAMLLLLVHLLPVLTSGTNSSSHGCVPVQVAPEEVTAWASRLSALPHSSLQHTRKRRDSASVDQIPRIDGPYGEGVVVGERLGSGTNQCSLQTLCYPMLTRPLVCYSNSRTCDGVQNCATGRDELYCDDCLCPYTVTNGVELDAPAGTVQRWESTNLKACARACNDVIPGCVGFTFSPLKGGSDRCIIYSSPSNNVVVKYGASTYMRESPSQPRLAPPQRTQSQSTQSSSGASSVSTSADCSARGMYNCQEAHCIHYRELCDGVEHCPFDSFEERFCKVVFGLWNKVPGRTISTYSVPEPGMSLESCAMYCFLHFFTTPKCDAFAYAASTKECRIGCSSCEYRLDVLPDNGADFYTVSVESLSGSVIGLLDVYLGTNPSAYKASSYKSSISKLTSTLSQRGLSVTSRPVSQLLSSNGLSSALQANPTSVSAPSVSSTATSLPAFGGPNAPGAPSQPSFNGNLANSGGGFPGQSGLFTGPTPPLVTSLPGLPADCGRRPLASLAAADQRTQSRVLQSSDTSNRVVAGHRASAGTYPWQAQIQAYKPAGYWEHHCGGVLIGPRHVLTAAHCMSITLSALQVVIGEHDRRDATEPYEQIFAIENAIVHPEYRTMSSSIYANDIAVLKLRLRQGRAVQFNTHVQPLCLPTATEAPPEVDCEISGWGKTDALAPNTPSSAADVLHGGVVPLVSDGFCAAAEVYGTRFLPERMVCAGLVRGGTDACQGDSGGPLACPRADGLWVATGIVSFGIGCGAQLRPGVYTQVSFFVPWIRNIIRAV